MTAFNTQPYYDDYNEDYQFLRMMFNPGRAIQARELTQIQTLLQKQVERIGDHIFKDGSVVTGGKTHLDVSYNYVKLQDTFATLDITPSDYANKTLVGSKSLAKARVINTAAPGKNGLASTDPNTLWVKYLSGNQTQTLFVNSVTKTELETGGVGATVKGNTSAATGRMVSYKFDRTTEVVEFIVIDRITGTFQSGEVIKLGDVSIGTLVASNSVANKNSFFRGEQLTIPAKLTLSLAPSTPFLEGERIYVKTRVKSGITLSDSIDATDNSGNLTQSAVGYIVAYDSAAKVIDVYLPEGNFEVNDTVEGELSGATAKISLYTERDITNIANNAYVENSSTAVGVGSAASIERGVYYMKTANTDDGNNPVTNGYMTLVLPQTIILEPYSSSPSYKVGLDLVESFVEFTDSSATIGNSLLDPANGYNNYLAPGADRYRITPTLVKKSRTVTDANRFTELFDVLNGQIQTEVVYPEYSELLKTLARRTHDESGSYTVSPFSIRLLDSQNTYTISKIKVEAAAVDGTGTGTATLSYDDTIVTSAPFAVGDYITFEGIDTSSLTAGVDDDEFLNRSFYVTEVAEGGKVVKFRFNTNAGVLKQANKTYGGTGSTVLTNAVAKNGSKFAVSLEPGKAYIKGYEFETKAAEFIEVDRARRSTDEVAENNADVFINYGDYYLCDSARGNFFADLSTGTQLSSDGVTVSLKTSSDSVVGVAKLTNIRYHGGLATQAAGFSGSGYTHRFYVNQITVTDSTNTLTLDDVGKIVLQSDDSVWAAISSVGKIDTNNDNVVDKTVLFKGSSTSLTFPLQDYFNVKPNTISDASYYTRYYFTPTTLETGAGDSGTVVFTAPAGKTFYGDGTLDVSVLKEHYHAVMTRETDASGDSTGIDANEIIEWDNALLSGQLSAVVSNDQQTLTIDFGDTGLSTSPSSQVALVATMKVSPSTISSTKKYVKGDTTTAISTTSKGVPNSTTGRINFHAKSFQVPGRTVSLGMADVYKIRKVIEIDPSASTTWEDASIVDITNRFILNPGYKDTLYDHSTITLKQGAAVPTQTKDVVVVFDFFEPSVTSGGAYTIDSYQVDIGDIPSFSGTGLPVDLKNCIDFRQHRSNIDSAGYSLNCSCTTNTIAWQAAGTALGAVAAGSKLYVSGLSKNTNNGIFTVTKVNNARSFQVRETLTTETGASNCVVQHIPHASYKTTVNLPSPNTNLNVDYTYFLPRKSKVYLDESRNFGVLDGVPTQDPIGPDDISTAMTLYDITIPSLTINPTDVNVRYVDNRRYTMRDIGNLERRIDRLEYYTQLSLLEKDTKDQLITDYNGLERFKNGILVDNFSGHSIGDVGNPDYFCSIDYINRQLRPAFKSVYLSLDSAFTTSSGITKTGDLITLAYDEEVFVNQPFAATTVSINPFNVTNYLGTLEIDPPSDTWVDQDRRPDVIINDEGENDAYAHLQAGDVFGTEWGNWNTIWTGSFIMKQQQDRNPRERTITPLSGNGKNTSSVIDGTVKGQALVTTFKRETVRTNERQTRSGIQTIYAPETITRSLGDKVVNVSVIPYIRSQNLTITANGMKPNTRVYAFFDNVNVTSYCTNNVGSGDVLRTDANGHIELTFAVPAGKFRTGTRNFRLIDNDQNSVATSDTSADGNFAASGLIETVQGTVISTRVPNFIRKTVEDKRVVKSQQDRTRIISQKIKWIDPLAQTFLVDAGAYSQGIFLSSVDLYFATKDDNGLPVTVQIREVENGIPTNSVVPLSTKTLNTSDISTSSDASVATRFTFDSPVYLPPGEFAVVVMSNSNDSKVWVSEVGRTDINTSNRITDQPYMGSLFKSQNGSTWTPDQLQDLTMKLNKCKFTSTSATASFVLPASSLTNQLGWSTATLSGTLTGDSVTSVSVTTGGKGYYTRPPAITISAAGGGSGATAVAKILNGSIVEVIVTDGGSGYSGDVTVTVESPVVTLDLVQLLTQQLTFDNTSLTHVLSTQVDTVESEAGTNAVVTLPANDDLVYSPRGSNILGRQKIDNSGTNTVLTSAFSGTSDVSPVIDIKRFGLICVGNIINGLSSSGTEGYNLDSTETKGVGGDAYAKYITRRVTLADGFDAKDLRVQLTATKPKKTKIEVYYKVLAGTDTTEFDDRPWVKMAAVGENRSAGTNNRDIIEYTYEPTTSTITYDSYETFKKFSIKVVMSIDPTYMSTGGLPHATATPQVPKINDLRVIALDRGRGIVAL